MTTIVSDKVKVAKPAQEVFEYLMDMNNILPLLPEEKVENWKGETDSCSFSIKGLAGIGMKRENAEEFSKISIVSHGKNPFDFTLDIFFESINETETEAFLEFNANMNMMLEMMAKTPLTNLFNMMANNLATRLA